MAVIQAMKSMKATKTTQAMKAMKAKNAMKVQKAMKVAMKKKYWTEQNQEGKTVFTKNNPKHQINAT